MQKLRKAVVLGGSGFLGRYLLKEIINTYQEVIVYDKSPILDGPEGLTHVNGDILDSELLGSTLSGCDILFHLAGCSDIEDCIEDPVGATEANILGTAKVLEAARINNVKKFVFASSLYVYSRVGGFYRVTKKACEELIEEYQKQFGLSYIILRFGTIYGPYADDRNSVFRYVSQAIESGEINYVGSGAEIREYIHVIDAVKQAATLANQDKKNIKYLITGNSPTRTRDLFELIGEVLGKPVKVNYDKGARGKSSHYKISPYAYREDHALKVNNDTYIDLGQGVLDLVHHLNPKPD